MTTSNLKTSDAIVIVGAGVFGLSTALHLAKRNYTDITVLDKHDYDYSRYSYSKGADAASADLNKVFRTSYGGETIYQELSFEAAETWREWNARLESGGDAVPPGMRQGDKVFLNIGLLSINEGLETPPFELATLKSMQQRGSLESHLLSTDPSQIDIANRKGFNIDPFQTKARGYKAAGLLDTTAGIVLADRACCFALHQARKLGVKFVFGKDAGNFDSYLHGSHGKITGVHTKDGKEHRAKLTVMACGGWTPTLVPELDNLAEATGGSVAVYKIPNSSKLYRRLLPENFPAFNYMIREGINGGLYGFPINDDGYFKIGYRGIKYTNPKTQADGKERSVPATRWSEGEKITQVPTQAMGVIKTFISKYLPEIDEEGIPVHFTRMCWYTDSYDNHFIIDHVPGREGLFIATGGSGHAFMYLPNIGKWVTDVIEGLHTERPAIRAWRWRKLGQDAVPVNKLMSGSQSAVALKNVAMTTTREANIFRTKL